MQDNIDLANIDIEKTKKNSNFVIVLPFLILFIVTLLSIKVIFNLGTVNVSGDSMYPNLIDKERLVSYKLPWKKNYERGQVVIFEADGVDPNEKAQKTLYVKRVVGIPGDKIEFNGTDILVNGKVIKQNFIDKKQQTMGSALPVKANWNLNLLRKVQVEPIKWNSFSISKYKQDNVVPEDSYFLMGDNREVSNDSRYFGFVEHNKIIGVVHSFAKNAKTINNVRY